MCPRSVLDPGQVPEIKSVTQCARHCTAHARIMTHQSVLRFPAHDQISGASKIPTVMYYDKAGNVCAAGAEAMREGILETAMDKGWVITEW